VIRDDGEIPVSGGGGVPGGVDIGGSRMGITEVAAPPPAKPVVVATPKPSNKPVQVGGDVQAAKLIRKIVPVYPRTAIIARISGTVRLQGIIGTDGSIQQLQVLSGPPLLINAALDAVRQWRYQPTLLNGEPVEVISPIDVIFTLSQ
jgi:protein TonB